MDWVRRDFIKGAAVTGALVAATEAKAQWAGTGPRQPLRQIATEEAWTIPEHRAALAMIGESAWANLDAEVTSANMANSSEPISVNLLDTRRRLAEMDRLGIDMQVLSLTPPGVQLFRSDRAVALAELANDRMAEIVRAAPKRFAGRASFAPQDPRRAVKEMERAVTTLGLNGFVVNSHTDNEYLDETKYWPILEAAEALDSRSIFIPAAMLVGQPVGWGVGQARLTRALRPPAFRSGGVN
jgi:2,3-dihydroxybenzoate decarboxylase/5-carboxyvanillate decarboxylase